MQRAGPIGGSILHISLTERLDGYVRQKVEEGLYNNASEVIREALRLQIASEQSKLEALRSDVDAAWQQADRGEFVDYSLRGVLAELPQDT